MNEMDRTTCRRNSWIAAAAAGILVAAMLRFVAERGWGQALLVGVIVGALLGLFLVWAFCSATPEDVSAPKETERPEAAPMPKAPPAEPARAAATPEPAQSQRSVAEAVPAAAPEVAVSEPAEDPKPAAKPKPATKPKPAAKAKPAKAEAARPKAATRKSGATAPAEAPKPRTGSALDAALAKSKEPANRAGPELLTRPRGGKADDLKQIRGVGPKLEKLLNDVGVWHFDQIASWKAKDIAVVDDRMEGFKGRITRDEWVKQAKVLAKGGSTEFSERVAKGDVY